MGNQDSRLLHAALVSQLSNVISMRSSHDNVFWAMNAIFFSASAILLAALFGVGFSSGGGIAACGVGVIFSFALYLGQKRVLAHISQREALMQELEARLEIPFWLRVSAGIKATKPSTVAIFLFPLPKFLHQIKIYARTVYPSLSILSAYIWVGVFVVAVVLTATD